MMRNFKFIPTLLVLFLFIQGCDNPINDGVCAEGQDCSTDDTAPSLAVLTIDNNNLYDYGTVITGSTTTHFFSVMNTGAAVATEISGSGLAAPYSFVDGSYPGTGGTCGTTLYAGSNCTIAVIFTPTVIGTTSDSIELSYNDSEESTSASTSIRGTAVPPPPLSIVISEVNPYDYGAVTVSGSASHTFILTNSGNDPVSSLDASALPAPFRFEGGSYPGSSGDCDSTLTVGQSCSVVVEYAPTTVSAMDSEVLQFNYFNGSVNQNSLITLQGQGVGSAVIEVSGSTPFSFGSVAVGGQTTQQLTMTNIGGNDATFISFVSLPAPFIFTGGTYPGTGGDCSASLAPAASCLLDVQYSPSALGTDTVDLELSYENGLTTQTFQRSFQGIAVAPATLTISEAEPFDYGSTPVGLNQTQFFTVTNTGSVTANSLLETSISAPFQYVGGTYPGTAGDCGLTLAPMSNCTLAIEFAPSATGIINDSITIQYNDGATMQIASRGVQGRGVTTANLVISETEPYDFGSTLLNVSIDHTFTITNTGGEDATGMTPASLAAPFGYLGGSYPGTGGDCTTTLASSANCTIVINYNPTVSGNLSAEIEIDYNNGAFLTTASRGIQGTGVSAAILTISESEPYEFGTTALGGNSDHTFVVTNTGETNASALSESGLSGFFQFLGGNYPGTGGTCGSSLAAGATCNLVVEFSPASVGPQSSQITMNYNDGVSAQVVNRGLQGIGGAPATLTISGVDPFDYGSTATGGSVEQNFIINNTGGAAATSLADAAGLSAPFTYKGGSYPGVGGTCSTSLNAGSNCIVVVLFQPLINGPANDTLELNYSDGVNTQSVTLGLQGSGSAPAVLTISESDPYDYGNHVVGSSTSFTFTVSNTGSVIASVLSETTLAAPFTFLGGSYPGAGGTCTTTLSIGGSCTLVIDYSPIIVGAQNQSITMSYFDGAVTQNVVRQIQGTGVGPAVISISEISPYDFGSLPSGGAATHIFTLTNTGATTATSMNATALSLPFSFTGGSYPGTGGDCSSSLATGSSCTVSIDYTPTSASPSDTENFEINFNDGTVAQSSVRSLQGTAVTPALLTVSESDPYNFGSLTVGATTTHTFTVTNTGDFQATGISEANMTAPFAYLGGSYPGTGGTCTTTLSTGASCTVVVEYSPTIPGTQTGTLDFNYNNGVITQSSTRDLLGVSLAVANILISETDTFDFGAYPVGVSHTHVFTLQNIGSFDATSLSEVGLAVPFAFTGGSFPGTGGDCTTTLASSSQCNIEVSFTPVATVVTNDSIVISYNNGTQVVTSERFIEGSGASPAVLQISENDPYDYGSVTTGGLLGYQFTITNIGGVSATSIGGSGLVAPFSFTGGVFPGVNGTCSSTIAAGTSCTVEVGFSPSTLIVSSDTLLVDYFDGSTSQQSARDIQGNGILPAFLTISESDPYDFGLLASGATNSHTFTLSNSGSSVAAAVSEIGLSAPFSFLGGSYPGTGGTCSTTLAISSSCTFVVEYAPVAVGAHSDVIEVEYNDGAVTQLATRSIQGTGGAAALISVSGVNPYDYGIKATGSSTEQIFNLSNTGAIMASSMGDTTSLAAPFTYKGGSYPGVGGTCGLSLSSGANCSIVVNFEPSLAGPQTDTIEINYQNGVITTSVSHPIQGTGAAPGSLSISESDSYDYGTIATGSSVSHTFSVTNTGGVTTTAMSEVSLAVPFNFVGGSYPGTGGSCGATLSSGVSCDIVIEFAPISSGTQNGTMTMSYNNGSATANTTRSLTGSGANPASISISETEPFDLGSMTVGGVQTHIFTLTNSGGVGASAVSGSGLSGDFSFLGGGFPGTGGSCSGNIAAGASCQIVVGFSPSTTGLKSGTFTVNYNDGATVQASSRGVTGTGVNPAILTLSNGPVFDYGNLVVGNQTEQTFTVQYDPSGQSVATAVTGLGLASPFEFKGGIYPGTGGTCGATIVANCTVVVVFSPGSSGGLSDTLSISYNDGAVLQSADLDLAGTGVATASLSISGSPIYNFGTVPVGGLSENTFTITNTGGTDALAISETTMSTPFSFKGGSYPGTGGTCSSSLASTVSCTLVVEFVPSATGNQVEVMSLQYNNGSGVVASTINLQGLAGTPAELVISDAPTYNFGNVAVGTNVTHMLTITNTGGIAASSLSGGGLASPYGFTGGSFPGISGDCGLTLGSALSCTVEIIYTPGTAGTDVDALEVNYYNGLTSQTRTRNIQAIALEPALLVISDGPTYDFGLTLSGNSVIKLFTVQNTGGANASLMSGASLSAPYAYTGGSYPGTNGTCATDLAAGSNCSVEIVYTPFSTSTDNQSLSLTYNNAASTVATTRALTGQGYFPLPSLTLLVPTVSPNNDTTPTIRVGSILNGLFVNLYADATCSAGIVNAGSSPGTNLDIDAAPLSDGTYEFHVTVQDSHGNVSNCSAASLTYSLDATDPTPSAWTWSFANGITDGGFSNIFLPQIQVNGIASENGTTIQLYENNTCVSAKGSVRTVAVGEATFLDISYASDGSDDGLKEFYAIATDTVGNVSSCQTITLDYTLDTQIFAPPITSGITCNELSGPTPTISVTCEPNAVVSIGLGASSSAVINPDPTTQTCSLAGTASIPLVFTTDGLASIEVTQDDAAGNSSNITSCVSTVLSAATVTMTTETTTEIVFDNKTNFPIAGTCSHAGTGNVTISGVFAGSPMTVDCAENETWSAILDFSLLPDDDLSVSAITATHSPGSGTTDGSVTTNFNNCRAVAQFLAYSNLWDFDYQTPSTADQIPIWNFGDGSTEVQQRENMYHVFSGTSFPYTVQIKHCPREIERFYVYTNYGSNPQRNILAADTSDAFPATGQYTNLTYMHYNNNNNNNDPYGLAGSAPDPDEFPLLTNYELFNHANLTSLPADIQCSGKNLRSYRFYYPRYGTNAVTHPTMGADCYDSITYYDNYCYTTNCGNYTGPGMDVGLFTSNITYYRAYRVGLTIPIPTDISNTSLRTYQIYNLDPYGGSCTGTQVPTIGNATALQHFELNDVNCSATLPVASYINNWPPALRYFYLISDNYTGTMTTNFLQGAPASLQRLLINNTLISGNFPTIGASLPALTHYDLYNNLMDISIFPDMAGNTQMTYYRIYGNPISNSTGPYPLPNWSSHSLLAYFQPYPADFTGQTMSMQDLLPTNMYDINIYNGGVDITSFDITGLNNLRYFQLQNNNFTGAPADAELKTIGPRFDQGIVRGMGLVQADCDAMFEDIWTNRVANNAATGYVRMYIRGSNSCTWSTDQHDRRNGTGAYVGDGLWSEYRFDVRND